MGKSQANAIIQISVAFISNAATRLQSQKFTNQQIAHFGGLIERNLRAASKKLVALAWQDGNGKGDIPYSIADAYITEQASFLSRWLDEIYKSRSLPGGAGRAAMYGESLGQCYQRAYVQARGARVNMPNLPAYPRDGSTKCLTHCRCQWKIVKREETQFEATWKLGAAEHCPDCIERSQMWNPLRIMLVNEVGWEMLTSRGQQLEIAALGL